MHVVVSNQSMHWQSNHYNLPLQVVIQALPLEVAIQALPLEVVIQALSLEHVYINPYLFEGSFGCQ